MKLMTALDYILAIVHINIFNHKGSGFALEANPEITKVRRFKPYDKFFDKDGETIWKECFFGESLKNYKPGIYGSDLNVSIDDNIAKALPKGVFIKKTEPVILRDETTWNRPTYNYGAHRVEGKRVYVTVTDEYAARFYKETYINVGLPFWDKLFNKYNHILTTITSSINPVLLRFKSETKFIILPDEIHVSGNLIGPLDSVRYIEFAKLGMEPSSSAGYIYGMALALVETLKKTFPEWSNTEFVIHYKDSGLQIDMVPPPKETPPKLKPW